MSAEPATRETDRLKMENLFFSRTDPRGVIQAANGVFVTVSGHEWSALNGAPHKVVRHPDMPAGVFHLMWEEIGAGRPFGGYVKNLTADHAHYWVFSVVLPLDDGFVSMRLKPSSEMFEQMDDLYSDLRTEEREQGATPEESQALLLQKLRDLGYTDYPDFMSIALAKELGARARALRHRLDPALQEMCGLADTVLKMRDYGDMIDTIFHSTALIPNNLSIQARSLEGANGPISVISTNHQVMAQSLGDILSRFRKAVDDGVAHTTLARFNAGVRLLTQEVAAQFRNQPKMEGIDPAAEARRLAVLATDSQLREHASVGKVMGAAAIYRGMSTDMRRVMSGLEMSRVMCKIEQSKYASNIDGLNEIVGRLHRAERQLSEVIDSIETGVCYIEDRTNRLTPGRAA
ncbi:hypothetical protein [Pseudosulfitobacter sp. DSM 107133]|uniref:hypothetical protein n=1 Tax=Pseudosulfitobacter sp. DSM 107133 TaxID=2883100 RepID=UPI000DF2933A|nr:hypothetical protein [Pseudosulfitobacter sp. DSM 107133]